MSDVIPILFDYCDLKTKYKLALINREYFKLFNNYKMQKFYTSANIKLLINIIKKWRECMNNKRVNIWSPKNKPFDIEIILF